MKKDILKYTKTNIKDIIKAINENEIKSQKELAELTNMAPSNVSYNIRRINKYENGIWKENKIYKTKAKKPEDFKFIKEIEMLIKVYDEKPEIIKWQDKNICKEYNIERFTVQQFRAYIGQGTNKDHC